MINSQSRQQVLYTSPPHNSSNGTPQQSQGAIQTKGPIKATHPQKAIFAPIQHRDQLPANKQSLMTEGQDSMRVQHQHHTSSGFVNNRFLPQQQQFQQQQQFKMEVRSPSTDNLNNKENYQTKQAFQPQFQLTKNSGSERVAHTPNSPIGNSQKGGVAAVWQHQQQQVSQNVTEAVKLEVSEQMDHFRKQLVEGYESLMKEFLCQNQQTSEEVKSLRENVTQHENALREVGDSLQVLQNRVQQCTASSQLSTVSNGSTDSSYGEDAHLKNKINEKIRENYSQKIKQIEQGQSELREVLENVRGELFEEIQTQMERVAESAREKSMEEDAKLYDYVRELRNAWEERLTMIVQTMSGKMEGIEKQLTELRGEEHLKDVQSQMYAEIDACVQECEKQLMQLKIVLDGKLDRGELEEVLEGYRAAKTTDALQRQAVEVQGLRAQLSEQTFKTQKNEREFEVRLQSFETFMRNTVGDMEARLKDKQSAAEEEKNLATRVHSLEQRLNAGRQDISALTQGLEEFDARFNELKRESDQRLQRVVSDLQREEREAAQAVKQHEQQCSESRQESATRMGALEKQLAQLLSKMNQFEQGLDREVQEFTQQNIQNENLQNFNRVAPAAKGGMHSVAAPSKPLPEEEIENFDNCQSEALSHKLDSYLKKYENFSQNVASYLQQKQSPPSNSKTQDMYNHPQIGAVNLQELVSPQRGINASNITNSPCVNLYNSSAKGASTTQHVRQASLEQVQRHLRMSSEEQLPVSSQAVTSSVEENRLRELMREQQQRLSAISEREGEDDEVVYQLDDRGYLLDEHGNIIVDDEGRPIQLSQEHIEYLRSANMLEDDQK